MVKFYKELEHGYYLIIPFIDELKNVEWTRVEEQKHNKNSSNTTKIYDLTYIPIIEQFHDLPPYNIVTNDRIRVYVNALVFYKIVNVRKAIYRSFIRRCVTCVNFETIYLSKDVVTKFILDSLTNVGEDWGIKITRFEIQDVKYSKDILTAT